MIIRLGKRQREILEYIRNNQPVRIVDLYLKFSTWKHKADSLSGFTDGTTVTKILDRLLELGLITVKNRYRSDCTVFIKE